MYKPRNNFKTEVVLLIAAAGMLGFSLAHFRFHADIMVAMLVGCSALLAIGYAIAQTRNLTHSTPHPGIRSGVRHAHAYPAE
jgi:hypothetical protein